jgi:hypothetical protein
MYSSQLHEKGRGGEGVVRATLLDNVWTDRSKLKKTRGHNVEPVSQQRGPPSEREREYTKARDQEER